MKAKPLHNYKLLGTDIVLDVRKTYGFSHATNQPDWEEKGLIFIHERKYDPVGVLLERGEYLIV
jgi:hypothetical protein